MRRAAFLGLAIPLACSVALAHASPAVAAPRRKAAEPAQVVPPKPSRGDRSRDADPSEGGTRRGITELTLGSVTAALAAALIGRGIWEIGVGRRTARRCEDGTSLDTACARAKPENGGYTAAGLSMALAVPIAVASGFLLARGIRIHRAHRAHQAKLGVAATPRGAALSLAVRF